MAWISVSTNKINPSPNPHPMAHDPGITHRRVGDDGEEGRDWGHVPELHPAKMQQLEGRAAEPTARVPFTHTWGKCSFFLSH